MSARLAYSIAVVCGFTCVAFLVVSIVLGTWDYATAIIPFFALGARMGFVGWHSGCIGCKQVGTIVE